MKYTTENPRYTAYSNSAFGYQEAGTSTTKAAAWKLARAAAKKRGAGTLCAVWPEIHDAAANAGQGGFTFPLNESY